MHVLSVTLPFLLLTSLAAVASASCQNLPISFSTTFDLTYGRTNFGGTATAVLEDGTLSVTYNVVDGCTLTDAVHVTLVSNPTALGDSRIPAPGRFPCKQPASGTSLTLSCNLASFPIDDCCADSFRLFAHAVVDCGTGEEETAFGGSGSCSTRRWCFFQEVTPTIDCPLCNACSTAAAACAPIDMDDRCGGTSCDADMKTVLEDVCKAGSCVPEPIQTCPICQTCPSGGTGCENAASDPDCSDITCDTDMKTLITEKCMGGSCMEDTTTCPTCQTCPSGGDSCENTDSDPDCSDIRCDTDMKTLITEKCMGGSCMEDTTTCPTCQTCPSGGDSCENASSDPDCSGFSCSDATTLVEQMCMSGECKDMVSEVCDECDECSAAADGSTGACVFDTGSPGTDTCSTCGEVCELTGSDGKGECVQQCVAGETCVPGGGADNLDMCGPETCMVDADCASDPACQTEACNCIDGECVPVGDCGNAKQALCDEVFASLGGQGNSGKCCPDTSACVSTTLNLGTNSVCSTECGVMCSLTEDSNTAGVPEIYCVFGDSTGLPDDLMQCTT